MFGMIYTRQIGILHLIGFAILVSVCVKTSALGQEPVNSKADLDATAIKDSYQPNDDNKNRILASAGLLRSNDFGLAKITACTIFGAIGFVAFMYGKKNAFWRPMTIGVALMAYPYFVSGTLVIYLTGIVLTAALYFWRG